MIWDQQPQGRSMKVHRMKFTEMASIPSLDVLEKVPQNELEKLCDNYPLAMAQAIIDLLESRSNLRKLNTAQADTIKKLTGEKNGS